MNSTATIHQNFLRRGAWAGLALAAGFLLGGCAAYSPTKNLDLFVRTAPLPVLVPPGMEMDAAEAAAAKRPGDLALHGVGSSMEPIYLGGTAVVVRPCSYRLLRTGMAIVYVNRHSFYVAHMLVEQTPAGWLAIGLNNKEPDDDLVTPENLVGVIKQAFTANDAAFRPDLAAQHDTGGSQPARAPGGAATTGGAATWPLATGGKPAPPVGLPRQRG